MDQRPKKLKFYQRKYLIDKKFQFKYTFIIIGLCSVVYCILGTYFYKTTLEATDLLSVQSFELKGIVDSEDNVTLYYLCAFFVVQVFSLLMLGTILTHKIAGPAFRIIRAMEDIASGKLKKIGNLRRFDELQNFIEPVNHLIESINQRLRADIEALEVLKAKIILSVGVETEQKELTVQIDFHLKEKEELKKDEIESQKKVVRQREQDVEGARLDVMKATQELKTLEKHKEKLEDEWKKEQAAKEEDMLDELGQTIFRARQDMEK